MLKTFVRFTLAAAFGFGLTVAASGCGSAALAPALQKGAEIADCQLKAVRALVPHVETADAAVAAFRIGDVGRGVALLQALGMKHDEIIAVAKAFDACLPEAPAAPAEPRGDVSL